MSYSFPKDAQDGDVITLDNGVTYKYDDEKDRWLVQSVASGGIDRSWQKDFTMQLRGNFKWNADQSAAKIPANSYFNADDHPDVEPDPNTGWKPYWQKPGVWWLGGVESSRNPQWTPRRITHLLISSIRYREDTKPGADTPWDEWTDFNCDFEVGDFIQVRSFQEAIDHLSKEQVYGDYTNNVWRVTKVIPVEDDPNWGVYDSYRCYEVEKVGPDHYYQGSVSVFSSEDFADSEGYFPAEVFHNYSGVVNDALQIQIDELEQEIDIIAPRLDGAQYKYASSYAVKPGEMFIGSNSFTAATDVVFFNDVALDGTTHAWGSLNEGDYLEITDTNQKSRTAENYAMYLCTKEPEGTGMKQIEVALVKGSGAPTVGDVLDAKGFELGGNDINDLDSRYDLKQSHLKQYRTMKVVGKDWSYNNFNEIPAESNCLNMTNTSFRTTQGFIMKDLGAWFPPDKYDFVPGMVTVLEPYVGSGRSWEIEPPVAVWLFWAAEVKEWSPTRQRIQGISMFGGNSKNSSEYPSTGMSYQVNFQCFRKK